MFQSLYVVEYLGTMVTNKNCSKLSSRNACCHVFQNLFFFHLLSKHIMIKIYKTIILPIVSYGCKTLCVMLRVEHKLRAFENRVLRIIFG
jgi:hypothetical protein